MHEWTAAIQIRAMSLLLTSLLVSGPISAHHDSYACIARDRSVSVEGIVEDIRFEDPHVVLTIKTDRSIVVTVEWRPVWELANRWGITRDILRRGDRIYVRGSPYECEQNRMAVLVEIRRLEDGWFWTAAAPRAFHEDEN